MNLNYFSHIVLMTALSAVKAKPNDNVQRTLFDYPTDAYRSIELEGQEAQQQSYTQTR